MPEIIFNTELKPRIKLISESVLGILFKLFWVNLGLVILSFLLFEKHTTLMCLIIFVILSTYTLLMTLPLNRYIYRIDIDGDVLEFYYRHWGKLKTFKADRNNLKIRCYKRTRYTPWIIFEQKKPYKFLYRQYGFGHWSIDTNVAFIKMYVTDVQFLYR